MLHFYQFKPGRPPENIERSNFTDKRGEMNKCETEPKDGKLAQYKVGRG